MTAKGRCSYGSNGNPAISEAARRVLYHAMNAHSYDMTRADFSGLRRQQAEHKIAFDCMVTRTADSASIFRLAPDLSASSISLQSTGTARTLPSRAK
jgi:hypothetical protein